MDLMRPAVQADGGDLVLVRADVETGVVEVQLQGACSSCAISSATLSGGVERILRERLPWVTEVIGGLDDSLSLDESAALGSGRLRPVPLSFRAPFRVRGLPRAFVRAYRRRTSID